MLKPGHILAGFYVLQVKAPSELCALFSSTHLSDFKSEQFLKKYRGTHGNLCLKRDSSTAHSRLRLGVSASRILLVQALRNVKHPRRLSSRL